MPTWPLSSPELTCLRCSSLGVPNVSRAKIRRSIEAFYKKLKNVSCEYDRVNGWHSTLQAAWYIRHVRWACLFCISFIMWCLCTKPTMWLLILSFTREAEFWRIVSFPIISIKNNSKAPTNASQCKIPSSCPKGVDWWKKSTNDAWYDTCRGTAAALFVDLWVGTT